jgi:ubiquinone/menaquinone biosynthesis C-methylase UbiE
MPQQSSTIRQEILAYYEQGREDARLRSGIGRLEFLRTQDILRRLLPAAPARILDIGGGSGIHAAWLAEDGHQVELLDPVPLHVTLAAQLPGVSARLGDARALHGVPDSSADAVLLLGPLYHLIQRAERVQALTEARRVVQPGGLVIAATINRFAGLHDMIMRNGYYAPTRRALVDAATEDGHNRSTSEESLFTTAYFHDPAEVPGEFTDAGLTVSSQHGVEGAVWLMPETEAALSDPARRDLLLEAVRRTESVPTLLGISGHLLTAGRRE